MMMVAIRMAADISNYGVIANFSTWGPLGKFCAVVVISVVSTGEEDMAPITEGMGVKQ